jgi:predicted glutamine amidotransferase
MSKEKILALDKKLSEQRNEWTIKIQQHAKSLRYINGMEDTIAMVLSDRQKLIDHIAYINIKIKEQRRKIADRYREAYLRYYEYDYKLGEKQKERFIESDLADENAILSHLENQLDFFKESVKTLDNMGFAIRNRLSLKDL